MKVPIFITSYKSRMKRKDVNEENVIDTITELIHPKSYISFDNKCKLVEATIESVKNEKYKTAKRYRQFIINLVSAYTDLEIDNEGFDSLCETKLLDIILSTFKSEYQICNGLMTMYLDDEWR